MTEHLTDSNILQSRKTYQRKKTYMSLSMSSENSGSYSATAVGESKNNGTFVFSSFNKELYVEENSESVTNVISDEFSKNEAINSENCLFNDEDTDYYFSITAASPKDHKSSISGTSNFGSKYQRTRKNLKHCLSNQELSSEEMLTSMPHEENLKNFTDANNLKSASNFLSIPSINNQAKTVNVNKKKFSNACVNKPPQKSNLFQIANLGGKTSENRTMFQNPSTNSLMNTNFLPIVDLVNRFAASSNKTHQNGKLSNKRKGTKVESESTPAKKIAVVKNIASLEINSAKNNVSNSSVSIKTNGKNIVLKRNKSSVNNLGVKKGEAKITKILPKRNGKYVNNMKKNLVGVDNVNNLGALIAKTPSKAVQEELNRSANYVERNAVIFGSINNIDSLKKGNAKTPTKAVLEEHNRSIDSVERSLNVISNVSNIVTSKKSGAITPPKAVQKGHNRSINSVDLGSLKKVDVKTPSKTLKNGKEGLVNNTERSIKLLTKFLSKNNTKCPSSTSLSNPNLRLVKKRASEKIKIVNNEKQIEKTHSVQLNKKTVQNQMFDSPSINAGSNFPLYMPMIIAPRPPTSQEGAVEVTPLCIWNSVPSISYNHFVQNDDCAVSYGDVSIPGPSALSNGHSSMKASDYSMKKEHLSNSICLINDITTTTTIINQSNLQNRVSRPRTLVNDGIEFQRFAAENFKSLVKKCMYVSIEHWNKTVSVNPSLQDITVSVFCKFPAITDVLLDYLTELNVNKSLSLHDIKKGYDFPPNFQIENFIGLVKDFVHTALFNIIPANAVKPINISYSQIMKAAMLKMSEREFLILMRVFKKTEQIFTLKDVIARLGVVGLLVIFDEYKIKNKRFR